ncbi:class I SAM-dependent RNA methyltransferase [Actinospongicola halichondriae]|uniref:class I SAM-dependent RNA methyltransferase n=1 Tax=Actinospongicola halichondriae TaxID=3236844 RepID=UPI003D549807
MDPLELAITDVAAGGDGIGHASDGRVVLVRGAIPGDIVQVEITEDRPRMLRGVAAAVLEPSDDRITPPCPHVAAGCGGCGWQHVDPAAQRRLKIRIAEESLRRIGRIDGTILDGPPLPDRGFRTTVRCLVVDGRAAFRTPRGHDGVVVDSCMVAHPLLQELIADGRFGSAHEVTLRVGAETGERLVRFDPAVPADISLPPDVRVVGADELGRGRRSWFTDRVEGITFRISAESFFQTRTDGAAALVDAVRRAGDGMWGSGTMIDLYGGVGLFAACLGDGMSVTDVESNRAAAADARHNLSHLDAQIIRAAAQKWTPSAAHVVVADPPRAGLGADVVRSVAATEACRLVLVSCDPASFGRDTRLLSEAGYERTSTTAIDLFPQTPHVELVSRFERS